MQVGWIYVLKEDIKKEYGKLTKENIDKALKVLVSEIEIYNQYLNCEVFGYEIVKKVQCEHCGNIDEVILDSCWGFFGYDMEANGIYDAFKSFE